MVLIKALNNARSLALKPLDNNKVEIVVTFGYKGEQPDEVTAIVDWKELHQTLWSHKNVHDFADCNLRRVIRTPREHTADRESIYSRLSIIRMFFTPSPAGADLIVVSWADLKKALDKTKPK